MRRQDLDFKELWRHELLAGHVGFEKRKSKKKTGQIKNIQMPIFVWTALISV